jgi:hypothetical protein
MSITGRRELRDPEVFMAEDSRGSLSGDPTEKMPMHAEDFRVPPAWSRVNAERGDRGKTMVALTLPGNPAESGRVMSFPSMGDTTTHPPQEIPAEKRYTRKSSPVFQGNFPDFPISKKGIVR